MDKLFIKAVYDAFTAAAETFTDMELPPVAHIDKFRGQPLTPEQFELFELPAVFIAMRCNWVKSGRSYNGEMVVDFHIVQDATWETSNIATNLDEGLKQIDFLTACRRVLDNLTSPNTGKLNRITDNQMDTGVSIYDVLTYGGTYSDPVISETKKYITVTPDISITGELVKKLNR